MSSSIPSSSSPRESGKVIHRRETLRQIVLPFLGAGLVILLIFLISALMRDPLARYRVSIIADFLFMLMVLCPSVLCMFGVYLLVAVAIYGMNVLHRSAGTPLQRLENATETMAKRIETWTNSINRRVANLSVRFAPLSVVLSLFDKPEENHHESEQTTDADE